MTQVTLLRANCHRLHNSPPPSLSSCTNYFLKKKCHYCHQRTFSQVSPVTDGVTDGDTVTEGCVTDLSPPGPDGIDPQPCYRYDRGSNGKECEDMRKKGEGRGGETAL